MDTPQLAPTFLSAGKEYVETLERLGMDIEIACWAYDAAIGGFVLLMVTDFFDAKGPMEISKVLFRAYRASVTPTEVDPFMVRLHSTNHKFASEIRLWAPGTWVQQVDPVYKKSFGVRASVKGSTSQGITFHTDWLIKKTEPVSRKTVDISRRWDRFVRNVEKAAA